MACAPISRSARARLALREFEVGNAARALGDQPVDFRLERTRIDLKQQLALLDACAIGEGNAVDVAAHPRTDFHGVDGLQTSGEFLPLTQRPVDHLGHRDLRQRGVRDRLRLGARVSDTGEQQADGEGAKTEENRRRLLQRPGVLRDRHELLEGHVRLRSKNSSDLTPANSGRFRRELAKPVQKENLTYGGNTPMLCTCVTGQ